MADATPLERSRGEGHLPCQRRSSAAGRRHDGVGLGCVHDVRRRVVAPLADGADVPALYAAAVAQRCAPCANAAVYLVDEFLMLEGGGDPLPGAVGEALTEAFGDVRLTSPFGVAALEGQGARIRPRVCSCRWAPSSNRRPVSLESTWHNGRRMVGAHGALRLEWRRVGPHDTRGEWRHGDKRSVLSSRHHVSWSP